MARLTITLLGQVQFSSGAGSVGPLPKKSAALLAYLARRPGQAHSREKLAALLWSESSDASAREGLRHALLSLRRALPPGLPAIVANGTTLALAGELATVDLVSFESALAENTPAALERAATLYRGELLAGFDLREPAFDNWLNLEREQIFRQALNAAQRLLAHRMAAGETEPSIDAANRLLELDPTQEDVHRSLMKLYVRLGRRQLALRQYQVCVATLRRELDIEPEGETRRLYEEILRPLERKTKPQPSGPAASAILAPMISAAAVPPLVGRAPVLARLYAAIDEARRGRGRVVAIEGEAGIGKSRIIGEAIVESVQRGDRVVAGYAYETEQVLPFAVWVDACRRSGVIDDIGALGALPVFWRAELARLFPELGVGVAAPPPAQDPRRLFEAMEQLFRRLAGQPLVVVLEDLHWADETSIRLLSFLARRLQGLPVAFAVTVRAEELADAPGLERTLAELERAGCLERVSLTPLSPADTADLVRALARDGSEEAALGRLNQRVWSLSEGNPFVVTETMRALEEAGPPGSAGGAQLPLRVREVIAGRFGRLGTPARRLAEAAAVIGRDADFALIARAAGLGDSDAATGFEELVRRRILHPVGEQFDFTHDRLRMVAYEGILPPRRRILHREVAESIEALYASQLHAYHNALAHHFQRSEVWDKAVHHLALAAAQAAERSSHGAAAALYEAALTLIERLPSGAEATARAIELRLDLHNVSIPLADFERSLSRLREAETLAAGSGDRRRLARIECSMAEFLWTAGRYDEAITYGERAITAAAGELAIVVQAKFFVGASCYSIGAYRAGAEALGWNVAALHGDRAREFFGRWFLPSTGSRHFLSWCLDELGEFDEALAQARACIEIDQGLENGFCIVNAPIALGIAFVRRGDLDQGTRQLELVLEKARTLQVQVVLPWIASHLGYAYVLRGETAPGLALLEEAVSVATSMRLVTNAARCLALLGEGYLLAGRIDDARAAAGRALQMAREHRERGDEGWALLLLGTIAIAAGDEGAATEHLAAAAKRAQELDMRPLRARCHLAASHFAAAKGNAKLSASELAAARSLFAAMQMPYWMARAETPAAAGARGKRSRGGR